MSPQRLAEPREPGLTAREVISRAKAMRQVLRDEQEAAARRGHYSEQVHKMFVDAGFYHLLTPKRYGGYEFDVPTFFKVMVEVSRGDPASGWCLCLGCGHNLTLASHWAPEAQDEIFMNPKGYYRSPHSAAPQGTATPVDDGYLIEGSWGYCSGIQYASHFKGSAVIPAKDGPPSIVVVVVPDGQYRVVDDWGNGATLGQEASGSNTVVVDKVVVPRNYVVPFHWVSLDYADGTFGTEWHKNPMYLGHVAGFYHGELVSTVVGAAKAALDEYENIITTKKTTMPPQVLRYQSAEHQQNFGLALSLVDSAEALLMHAGEKYMEYCARWASGGPAFTVKEDARLYGMIQYAGRTAADAVELLFASASSSAAKRGERMQRYLRDVAMYRGHFSAQHRRTAEEFGRVYFGEGGIFGGVFDPPSEQE